MLKKENALELFDIYPKVVPVGKPVSFTLQALDPDIFFGTVTHLDVIAVNGATDSNRTYFAQNIATTPLEPPMHGFRFTLTLPTEDEYQIHLVFEEAGIKRPKAVLTVAAVEDDLLYRSPLVGDFHAHTYFSDGNEGPAFVAARYRRSGYDFLAVTDHRRRAPSLRAIAAYEGLNLPFRLYPGEEVHPNKTYVHIVNFASDKSANAFALREKDAATWRNTDPTPEYEEELRRVMAELPEPLPHEDMRREIASAVIVARIIREGGGLAILAHPHWQYPGHNVPDAMYRYFFEHHIFDALELQGGLFWYENQTQNALWEELRAQGHQLPVVGSSDEHGVLPKHFKADIEYFTEERTLLLAKENTREGIIEAVKNLYSVAMQKDEGSNPVLCGGNYRLRRYMVFLLRNYFPIRDEVYFEQGRLMHAFAAGTPGAKEKLLRCVADSADFESKYFYRP